MKPIYFAIGAVAILLSACAETTISSGGEVDPLTAALAGKTLVSGGNVFNVAENGTITGQTEDGRQWQGLWAVSDGKWCNSFSEPQGFAETVCQEATLEGDGTVTIASRNGGENNWQIQ